MDIENYLVKQPRILTYAPNNLRLWIWHLKYKLLFVIVDRKWLKIEKYSTNEKKKIDNQHKRKRIAILFYLERYKMTVEKKWEKVQEKKIWKGVIRQSGRLEKESHVKLIYYYYYYYYYYLINAEE